MYPLGIALGLALAGDHAASWEIVVTLLVLILVALAIFVAIDWIAGRR